MRHRHLTILTMALLLVAGVLAMPSPAGGVAGFGDVDSGQFYTAPVQWMVDKQITTGTSPTCFSPADVVTRGQAAAFMWRMEGSPAGSPPHSFTDVVAAWQQDPISWMAATGITTGTSATTYTPEGLVTRGEVAALLHRLAGSPDAPPSQFSDVTTSWQITPVGWLVQQQITTGTTATTFSPDQTVTRGEIATFFYRYKGSPAVTVDPTHPAMPACDDQVPGPSTTGTITIITDTQLIQNHNGPIIINADNITLDCAGHTVTGNGTGTGILVEGRTGVSIRSCDVAGFRDGIVLNNSNGNTIQANTVHNNMETGKRSFGIGLAASSNNTISANLVTGNCDPLVDSGGGIELGPESDANTVEGNRVTGNGSRGIQLWLADHNLIKDNEVRANGDHGIGIGGAFNRIEANQVIGNGTSELWGDGSGIRLGAGSSDNQVVNNNFDGNVIGISPLAEAGTGNTFTGNTANNNAWWGIEDPSTGGTGDAGTDNFYSNNTCTGNGIGNSSPYGLCFG